ncbi:hypothetical protein BSNK01_21860 [Bacillaceae bacterium]
MRLSTWRKMLSVAVVSSLVWTIGCETTEPIAEEAKPRKAMEAEQQPSPKGNVSVPVVDYTFDTAGNMFAYTEFELSGEPLAEGLGLDLDLLDPREVDKPTKFDYTAGIESYEYSEEGMYEVVEKSGLGLHLIHGPAVAKLAEKSGKPPAEVLAERFYHLADAVGYPREEIFLNMFPTFIEYAKGDPHYPQKVDVSEYAANEDGTYVPFFQVDFKTLRWDREKMDKVLNPSAYGATFLKQALWAGDFLSGMHTVDGEEELEAKSAKDDQDANIALGVSSADGMQGMILTEEIWNKLLYVRDHLFYQPDGKKLGALQAGAYLPHKIEVTEDGDETAPNAEQLNVSDTRSLLQDQWLMLWPLAEFFGMTDQREANPNVNPAFRAVFDGDPFPAAPKANVDGDPGNDVPGDDPFTVTRNLLLHIFANIDKMHFNPEAGAFVAEHGGNVVDAFQAGYTMEALRMFQRAIDGLPVGYASAEAAEGLKTKEGQRALEMIRKQADFMLNHMLSDSGLVVNAYAIGKGPVEGEPTLRAQLGAIRGLTAAFLATKDERYRQAARKIYKAMEDAFYDEEIKVYRTRGEESKYDPFLAGALSGVFRNALQTLYNTEQDGEKIDVLERDAIISRYTDFYDLVIDGPSLEEGMQASEFWDTGDFYQKGDDSGNTDGDDVPQIQAGHGEHGIAPILVTVEVKKR